MAVDQQRQTKSDDDLQDNSRDHKLSGRLQANPHVLIGEDITVIVQADEPQRQIGHAQIEAGERQPDHPDQREDVDRQQQRNCRRYEQPGDSAIRQAARASGDLTSPLRADAIDLGVGMNDQRSLRFAELTGLPGR